MSRLDVVILAAGEGKRMKSQLPKVLHRIGGRTLLELVVRAAQQLSPEQIHVVIGHGGVMVQETLPDLGVTWVEQTEQLGTGHAVEQAVPGIPDDSTVLVLYADGPLIRPDTLRSVIALVSHTSMGLITIDVDQPKGYGRILRNPEGAVCGIVEERDASEEERLIHEINTGIMTLPAGQLKGWLAEIDANNSQGEYYLTDVIALAVRDEVAVDTVQPETAEEVLGVNDRVQLAHLERHYQRQEATRLMLEGATLCDPERVDVRGEVVVGQDVFIDVNVVFVGNVSLGDRVKIGPNVVIKNSEVGADTEIFANCVIEEAVIGGSCRVGPYSRVRPDTELAANVHIGKFCRDQEVTDRHRDKGQSFELCG